MEKELEVNEEDIIVKDLSLFYTDYEYLIEEDENE